MLCFRGIFAKFKVYRYRLHTHNFEFIILMQYFYISMIKFMIMLIKRIIVESNNLKEVKNDDYHYIKLS